MKLVNFYAADGSVPGYSSSAAERWRQPIFNIPVA